MRRPIQILVCALLTAVLGLLTSCRVHDAGTPVLRNSNNVRMGYAALRISLPVFVAQDRGLFQKRGLHVQLQKFDTAQPMMDALVSGGLDVGGYCALPIAFSSMKRSKVDILFTTALMEDRLHPISMLIVMEKSGIQSMADLRGKRIGILPTRAYEVWIRTILEKNGVDPADVVIQQVPPSLEPAALASGAVQALFTNDPAATSTLARPGTKLLVQGAPVAEYIGEPFYFGSFNLRKDWVEQNPETAAKITQALDEAIDVLNADQNYAKSLMASFVDPKLGKLTTRYPDSLYRKSKEVSDADLEKIYSYYKNAGVIDGDARLGSAQYQPAP